MIKYLDVVMLKEAHPDLGLEKGAIGTVVEVYNLSRVEVEFANERGVALVITSFDTSELQPWSAPAAVGSGGTDEVS